MMSSPALKKRSLFLESLNNVNRKASIEPKMKNEMEI